VPWLWSLESTQPGKYAFLTAACPLLDVGDPFNFAAASALPPLVCSIKPYGPANQICAPPSFPNQTSQTCQITNMTFKPFLKGLARLSPTGPGPGSLTIWSCSSANMPPLARQQGASNAVYITENQNTARALMHCFCSPRNLRPRMLQRTVSCLQQCGPHISIIKGLQVSRFAIEAQFTKLTFLVIASQSSQKPEPATHLENRPEEEIKQGPATAQRLEQSCGVRCFQSEETYTMSDAGGKRPRHTKPLSKPCDARPCLVWRLTCASFWIRHASLFHCISTIQQPCASDDEQFWGKTSAKEDSCMGYIILPDCIHALSIFSPPILSDCVNVAEIFTGSVEAMPSRSFNSNFLEPWSSPRVLRFEFALPSITTDSQVFQHLSKKGTMKMISSSNGKAALFAVKPLLLCALSCKKCNICTSLLESTEIQSDRLRVFSNSTWSLLQVLSKVCMSNKNKHLPSAFLCTTVILDCTTIQCNPLVARTVKTRLSSLAPDKRCVGVAGLWRVLCVTCASSSQLSSHSRTSSHPCFGLSFFTGLDLIGPVIQDLPLSQSALVLARMNLWTQNFSSSSSRTGLRKSPSI
jgi:hypothetical protein